MRDAGLSTLDLVILLTYLSVLAAIGLRFSRRQQSLDTFLVAGHRMAWLPVGFSLMAALNSGIDYLTQPSATIQYGLTLVLGVASWVAVYPWVSTVVFPFYRRLNFYSIYEYLEARFDVRVRTLAAFIFLMWRLGWMATALYVPCLAIDAASGGQLDLTVMIIVAGSLATLYTMAGGIQAVVWNDVIQFFVMFGGLGATVLIVSTAAGGVPEIWTIAQTGGKTALWVPLGDPASTNAAANLVAFFEQPMTVPALFSALIVGRMAQYTTDQTMVLRVQTTANVSGARRAFIVNAAGDALWMSGLTFVGLALFAYFQHHPAPQGLSADRMLPYFMTQAFPAGAVGLVIAAILAASLSSVDAAIHSCSSVLVVDGYNRLVSRRENGRGERVAPAGGAAVANHARTEVRVARIATLIVGVMGTTLATSVGGIGTLLEIANRLINAFTGPLFGIFLLAMFSARATSAAALAGGTVGALTAYVVAYHSSIGFLWPSTLGLAATLVVGGAVTLVAGQQPSAASAALTWRVVMRSPEAA
ncbi:MAG: sodium:solute symporter family transporter [Acidobacteriota bacterium]